MASVTPANAPPNEKPRLPYEEAAEQITVTGWRCKRCGQFYGNAERAEHMARWCCTEDSPCECGGRIKDRWAKCRDCIRKADQERYDKRERKPIEYPVYSDAADKYFFDEDSLIEHLCDIEECDPEELTAEIFADARLMLCDQVLPRELDIREHCFDQWDSDESGDPPWDAEITLLEVAVNNWLKANGGNLWTPGKYAVDLATVPIPNGGAK